MAVSCALLELHEGHTPRRLRSPGRRSPGPDPLVNVATAAATCEIQAYQGCTPGAWKNPNGRLQLWDSPTDPLAIAAAGLDSQRERVEPAQHLHRVEFGAEGEGCAD